MLQDETPQIMGGDERDRATLKYFLFSEKIKNISCKQGWLAGCRGDGFVTEHQTTGGTDAVHC